MADQSTGGAVTEVKVSEGEYIDGLTVTLKDGTSKDFPFKYENEAALETSRIKADAAAKAALRGVITQQLLPLAVGKGRCAATEILVGTDAVANLIREGKCYQIPSILQSGAALGMHSLNADLARLVATGRITREAAERCATDKSDLRNYL